uniref:Uncharacterized protein n=1 Tax=Setaria italica TaxID=4555 RepID=K3ZFM7_SETIT
MKLCICSSSCVSLTTSTSLKLQETDGAFLERHA